ncbi:Wzy polymerase domain-containing protein [uncultured Propionivibrio sp.]|uniref:PglL family O-oligosaccharyltransferase n=1 Tax=uncultured Propionivibrio sp. TaxID=426737 RepID=UPI003747B9B3
MISHHAVLIPTFYREWIAALFGLISGAILLHKRLIEKIDIPVAAFIPLGLIFILAIQHAAHLHQAASKPLIATLYLLWSAFVMITAFNLKKVISTETIATTAALSILVGAMISAILLAMQLAHIGTNSFWVSPLAQGAGNLGQKNHLANYLWLGIASAIFLHHRDCLSKNVLIIILIALVTASSFTGSRSILLYSLVLLALSIWSYRKYESHELKQIAQISAYILCYLLLLSWCLAYAPSSSELSTATTGARLVSEASTTSIRLQLWRTGLQIFSEHPWFGVGVGQFPYQSYLLVGRMKTGTLIGGAEHTHNLIIQLLCEWGTFSLILLFVFGGIWWRDFIRAKWSHAEWWIAALLLVILTHSQLEYPLWYTFVLGTFSFALGLGNSTEFRYRTTEICRLAVAPILVLGATTLASLFSDYQQLEKAVIPTPRSVPYASDPERIKALSRIGKESLFADYRSLVFSQILDINHELLSEKIAVCREAIRFIPIKATAFKLVWLLALDKKYDEAIVALRSAIATYPGYVPVAKNDLAVLIRDFPEISWLSAEFDRLTVQTKK